MVTNEEKKTFIEQWLIDLGRDGQTPALAGQLFQLLMQDTNNGKLYKYRSFDKKGYALKSLKKGTLHCSCPTNLNDPFDCKIGITFSSLTQAIVGPVFAVMEDILNLLFDIIEENKTLEECSPDETRILGRLLSSRTFMESIQNIKQADATIEQKTCAIKKNASFVTELLQAVIADEFFAPVLGPIAEYLPLIIENITMEGMAIMLTQHATYGMLASAVGIDEDTDEIGLSLKISEKILPDQPENFAKAREIIADLESHFTENMNKLFRVGCLCTDYKNRLMWSHYADSHRGFCIEYDFSNVDPLFLSAAPLPVVYSDSRPPVPWPEALNRSSENTAKATASLMVGLLTKDKCWEYENEWRYLVAPSVASELLMPPVTCIYLGALISPQNRRKILKIAQKKGITVKQMTVDRGEYLLHAHKVFTA